MVTYVIEMVGHNYVKIGKTCNLSSRIHSIQNGSPYEVRVIARLRGDVESMLHAHLADLRVRGEWFRYDDRVREAIELLDKLEPWEPA